MTQSLPARDEKKPKRSRLLGIALPILFVPLALLMADGPARREKSFDYPTGASPTISVTNLSGQIILRGWEKPQVHAVCLYTPPGVEIDAEVHTASGAADKIHFTTHTLNPLVTGQDEAVDYTLDVPLGANLEIRNRQGQVDVERLQGDAWIETVSGSVSLTDVAGHLAVRSLDGDITLIRPSGRVEANSINGSIRFTTPASSKLRANTNSGKIFYEGDFLSGGDYTLSTYNGDMEILCPPSASFELIAKTVKGKLDNTLSIVRKRHPVVPYSATSLFGTRNTGAATVNLTSFSGSIHIHPQQ